jgi:hypothetical protein
MIVLADRNFAAASTGPIRDTYEPSASRRHTSSLRPVLTRTSRSAPVPAADDSGCGGRVITAEITIITSARVAGTPSTG